MTQQFSCPTCGAPLDAPNDDSTTVHCPYCNSSVIIPEEVRIHSPQISETSSQEIDHPDSNENIELENVVSEIASSKAIKPVIGATLGLTIICPIIFVVVLISGIILLALPGDPLGMLWARLNPFAFARLTLTFGKEGTGPGYFTDPYRIAIDNNSGNIYVSELHSNRVQAFNQNGVFVNQWSIGSDKTFINAVAVDLKGRVFVAANGDILIYDGSSGEQLGTVPHPDQENYYTDVFVSAAGGLIVVDDHDQSIIKMDSDFQQVSVLSQAIPSASGDTEIDTYIAEDGSGNIYALGGNADSVFKFGEDGKFITRFGGKGDNKGQIDFPKDIAIDAQGRIFVSDSNGIEVFDPNGRFLNRMNVQGAVFGIFVDSKNELFLASNADQIYRYELK